MNLIQQAVARADQLDKTSKLVFAQLEPAPNLGQVSSRSFRPAARGPRRTPLLAIALALLAVAAGAGLYFALANSRDEAAAVSAALAQVGLGSRAEAPGVAAEPKAAATNAVAPASAPAAAPATTTATPTTTAAAAAPTSPTPPAKAAAPADPLIEVRYTIDAWARAWSQRDVDAYLAYYGNGFAPERGASREAWAKARRQAIERRSNILVTISNLQLEAQGSDRVVARYTQDYAADAYRESGSTKRLVLAREGGLWRIVAESGTTTAPR